jgi:acyl carrier protein
MKHMPSNTDTQAVLEILAKKLSVPQEQLIASARIQADLGADSLDIADISMVLEERFRITIPDEQWGHDLTVGEVLELLARLQSQPVNSGE